MIRDANVVEQAVQLADAVADLLGEVAGVHGERDSATPRRLDALLKIEFFTCFGLRSPQAPLVESVERKVRLPAAGGTGLVKKGQGQTNARGSPCDSAGVRLSLCIPD